MPRAGAADAVGPAAAEVVCCGHVCVDLIPAMRGGRLPEPGELLEVGGLHVAAGGSVSNTGLALHKLGVAVRLIGQAGDDALGREARRLYDAAGPGLAAGLRIVSGGATSYTVVLEPRGTDRRFLHCPGVNERFTDAGVPDDLLTGAKLLHLGYPPLLPAMCVDDGEPLVRLFRRARAAGLRTSLDMSGVDPSSAAGAVDWGALLRRVLPWVDVFLPSVDELAAMTSAGPDELLRWGAGVLVVKDGERGLTIHSRDDFAGPDRSWRGRTLRAGTYEVEVRGTTGAGDVTIAGFLAGLIRGETLDVAADLACAAGAHCVMAPDAIGGLVDLDGLRRFIRSDPPRRRV